MKFIIHISIILLLWNCNPKQDTLPEEKYHQYKFGEITILDQDFPANAFAPLEGQLRYCHNEYRWCPRISPYDIGYYPVLAISQNKKTVKLLSFEGAYPVKELYKMSFADCDEVSENLKITVDTINDVGYSIYDEDLKYKLNFKGKLIVLENTSKKPILLDRFLGPKLSLEAKNKNGEWQVIQRRIGNNSCGVERRIHSERTQFSTLASGAKLFTKMFVDFGDFETECRIKYESFNYLDYSIFHTDSNTLKRNYFFNHWHKISPIYSNTFKQRIDTSRFLVEESIVL